MRRWVAGEQTRSDLREAGDARRHLQPQSEGGPDAGPWTCAPGPRTPERAGARVSGLLGRALPSQSRPDLTGPERPRFRAATLGDPGRQRPSFLPAGAPGLHQPATSRKHRGSPPSLLGSRRFPARWCAGPGRSRFASAAVSRQVSVLRMSSGGTEGRVATLPVQTSTAGYRRGRRRARNDANVWGSHVQL